jgi:cytochrome c oxidase accessory protein FixG
MSEAPRGAVIPIVQAAAGAGEIEQSLYEVRKTIHPRAVHGWFATWRWALVWFTQIVFYGLPWLSWNGRQAVLFDLEARKFHIFGMVFWPQDFIFLTVLLVISALSLFLFTAVAGRLWCGYACPQTVYTEIFLWIEAKFEGDRAARVRLDRSPWRANKLLRRGGKHLAWLGVALLTGLTFVGYFTPIRDLLRAAGGLALGPWEGFWVLFYGFATYGNAGWMREQVCKYMCPYARFQSAMFDRDTLIISYDRERGEPRGGRARMANPRTQGLGDCVDCSICVQVCPTGIDIRNGLQYECIGCAACIDGCNQVMQKLGYAPGLIRYSTQRALQAHLSAPDMWRRVLRPRVLIYAGILLLVVAAWTVALVLRTPLKVDVIRDRGVLARATEDGRIENVYRLRIMNTREQKSTYQLSVTGLPGVDIASAREVTLGPASTETVPLRVVTGVLASGSHRITLQVAARDDPRVVVLEQAAFVVPR